MDAKKFVKDRNRAFFSLDRKTIEEHLRKYDQDHMCSFPDLMCSLPDLLFWAVVHKVICNETDAPPEIVEKSQKWLYSNGFTPYIE